jgi:hypothetical protein
MGHISDTDTLHIREVIGCHRQHPSPSIHDDLARSCWKSGAVDAHDGDRRRVEQALTRDTTRQAVASSAGGANAQSLRDMTDAQAGRGVRTFVRLTMGLLPPPGFRTYPPPVESVGTRHWTSFYFPAIFTI